jgi:YD repeat-containing protein
MPRYSKSFLEESLLLKQRIAYSGANAEYMGYADPGASEDDAAWLIVKWTYDSNSYAVAKNFADGSKAFDKVWAERDSYTYA